MDFVGDFCGEFSGSIAVALFPQIWKKNLEVFVLPHFAVLCCWDSGVYIFVLPCCWCDGHVCSRLFPEAWRCNISTRERERENIHIENCQIQHSCVWENKQTSWKHFGLLLQKCYIPASGGIWKNLFDCRRYSSPDDLLPALPSWSHHLVRFPPKPVDFFHRSSWLLAAHAARASSSWRDSGFFRIQS